MPIIQSGWSHDRPNFIMETSIHVRPVFILVHRRVYSANLKAGIRTAITKLEQSWDRLTGWPRSGWPLSTTLCYKSITGLNHHTELLLIFHLVGSDIRKKYWKFHNDTVNSFGVMGKGNAIFQPYFHVTMSHFKFSYFLNSCPHKIEVLEQFIDFWLHSKYDFIWFIGHLMQITWKMTKLWHFTKKLISLYILAKT